MFKYKPTKNICDYHADIIDNAKGLQRLSPSSFESVDEVIDYINSIASDIEVAGEYALQAGNNMEYRLQNYRDSIESLGFTRNKKEK